MATDDVGFKVEKLTGDNYHHWKFQMKMCLIGKDLWEIVTGVGVSIELFLQVYQGILHKDNGCQEN